MCGLQLDTDENNYGFGVKVDAFFGVCMHFGSRDSQTGAGKSFHSIKVVFNSGVITIVNFILCHTMPLPAYLTLILKN